MKKYKFKFLVIILLLTGCNKVDERIYGDWCVSNDFYNACYHIKSENNTIVGEVLSYYDGTSRYGYDSLNPTYIFKNLTYNDTVFVDGISGETSKNTNKRITIKVQHQDTLLVETYLKKEHTIIEKWIRKTK